MSTCCSLLDCVTLVIVTIYFGLESPTFIRGSSLICGNFSLGCLNQKRIVFSLPFRIVSLRSCSLLTIPGNFFWQRGVGEKAVGTSISLVAPAEEREHQKICEAVKGSGVRTLGQVHVDGRLLSAAQERVSLATKIVACSDIESQVKSVSSTECFFWRSCSTTTSRFCDFVNDARRRKRTNGCEMPQKKPDWK